MKKSAMFLFAVIVSFNALIVQQIGLQQEVNMNNLKAQNKLTIRDHKIKLDSVIISSRSSDSEPWIRSNKQTYTCDKECRLVKIATTSGFYDWESSCVMESEISSQEMININKLFRGIYLYQLSDKMQLLKTGKLVIE